MRFICATMLIVCTLVISGCIGKPVMTTTSTQPDQVQGAAIRGTVHGGQNPISGGSVYLYAVGTGGYGGDGIAASSSNASTSLLNSNVLGQTPAGGEDGSNNYYATTDSNGNFSISGDYTCPSASTQVYLYAVGGNPGAGTNSAAGLLAGLGSCGSLNSNTFVFVNEVSTIATAYALAGFATDATHVSSSGSARALTGVANAFANSGNLATLSTGLALTKTPAGNGTVPRTTIDTLANILASCVNSAGPASTTCATLLGGALSGGTTGTAPTDTATAAINIAHNPGANIAALYALGAASPPFAPALTAQPNDFIIGLGFTGGGLALGYNNRIIIDSAGNAWIPNYVVHNTVTEYSALGAALSPSGGYTGGGLDQPETLAIDASGNVWLANANGVVPELSNTGSPVSSTGYTVSGLGGPNTIAVDGVGNIWFGNNGTSWNLLEITNTGTVLSGTNGFIGDNKSSTGMAIDGAGNVWLSGMFKDLKKFNSAGVLLSGSTGYQGGMSDTNGLAIDSSGNVWVTTYSASAIAEFSNAGVAISPSTGYTGGCNNDPWGIAIDGAGDVWVTNSNANCVAELSSSGATLSGATGYSGGLLNAPVGIAVDGSGDIWIMNGATNVIEMLGVAAPVITPIAAGLPATPTADGSSNLGTRP